MSREAEINLEIVENKLDTNKISDGYHTFEELYEHRIILFITLCRILDKILVPKLDTIWRSKTHSDGSTLDGWFIIGLFNLPGKQITYHLPISKWEETNFAYTLDKAPEFDGHTPQDVLNRLKNL